MTINLDEVIDKANTISPLPMSVSKLLGLLDSDDWSIFEVERTISYDPALTAEILRHANSAAFAQGRPMIKVRDAVLRLGAGTVLSLAMNAAVKTRLSGPVERYGFEENHLWYHSMSAAIAAEELSKRLSVKIPPEAPVTALLHDIGVLILSNFISTDLSTALHQAENTDQLELPKAELAVLGVHHGEVGAIAVEKWNLNETIIKGIQYHHFPDEVEDLNTDAVWLADQISHRIMTVLFSTYNEQALVTDVFHQAAAERLQLTAELFDEVVEHTLERTKEIISEFQ